MKSVFVSSIAGGYEAERGAACEAIAALDLLPVLFDDARAGAQSPQPDVTPLVEESDVFLLILGGEAETGVAAVQAEFRAARKARKPILVFVQSADYSGKQADFKRELESTQSRRFRESFSTPQELQVMITRALKNLRSICEQRPVAST